MKSIAHSLLAFAVAGLGMSASGSPTRPLKFRPMAPVYVPPALIRRPGPAQSPTYNQRKARKARRARWAAGDRKAFR